MLRLLLLFPLLILVAATVATTLHAIGGSRSAGQAAIVLMMVFAALFVLTLMAALLSRHVRFVAGTLTFTAVLAAVALVVVLRSDHFSLATAGADIDQALAGARGRLVSATAALPDAQGDGPGAAAPAAAEAPKVVRDLGGALKALGDEPIVEEPRGQDERERAEGDDNG